MRWILILVLCLTVALAVIPSAGATANFLCQTPYFRSCFTLGGTIYVAAICDLADEHPGPGNDVYYPDRLKIVSSGDIEDCAVMTEDPQQTGTFWWKVKVVSTPGEDPSWTGPEIVAVPGDSILLELAGESIGIAQITCPGDLTGDGHVNIEDIARVASVFNGTMWDFSEITGDGIVDIYDLVFVARHYGESLGG